MFKPTVWNLWDYLVDKDWIRTDCWDKEYLIKWDWKYRIPIENPLWDWLMEWKANAVSNSEATDLEWLVNDFNNLLSELRSRWVIS